MEYKKLASEARKTIDKGKGKLWEKYCAMLDFKTPTKIIWNIIKKIKGKKVTKEYPVIHNDLPVSNINTKLNLFKNEF